MLQHLGGHPKALELLSSWLATDADRLGRLLEEFDHVEREIHDALAAPDERHHRGRQLLIDKVLADLPPDALPVLDRMSLLFAPLPTDDLVALLEETGVPRPRAAIQLLRRRGLLAIVPSPGAIEGGDTVHRLVAAHRSDALPRDEQIRFHERAAAHFIGDGRPLSDLAVAAEHEDAAGHRAQALERYANWSRPLVRAYASRAAEQVARQGLERFPPGEREEERVEAARLWMLVADAHEGLGESTPQEHALEQAQACLAQRTSKSARFAWASIGLRRSRRLATRGEVTSAISTLEEAHETFLSVDEPRDAAIAIGDVARLKAQSGDVAGARERQDERLTVNRGLGDIDGIAAALFNLAQLDLMEEKHVAALPRLLESFALNTRLGRADGIAIVGSVLGQLLAAAGRAEARSVLDQSREAFLRLEQAEPAREIEMILASLPGDGAAHSSSM